MKFRLGLSGRLALILVAFGVAPLLALGALAYTNGRASLQLAAISELETRATEKQNALQAWIDTARVEVTAKAQDTTVSENASILVDEAPGSAASLAAHDALVRDLQPVIGSTATFTDVIFVEAHSARVLASTDPLDEGTLANGQAYFDRGKTEANVSEAYYSQSSGRPIMYAAAPVLSPSGRLLGVLAARLDLSRLNELIRRRSGLRQTDDAFIVNLLGLPVTQPRFLANPAVLGLPLHTAAVQRCLSGASGVMSADDYRGVPVFASFQWLPAEKMCLIVKIDQAEALAPVTAFTQTIGLTSTLTMLLAIVLAILLARRVTEPILVLQAGAARIGRGELGLRLRESGSAELRQMGRDFNGMVEALEKHTAALTESENKYRSLVENTTVGVYSATTSGEIKFVNEAVVRILGFDSPDELRSGGSLIRYRYPEARERLLEVLRVEGHVEAFEVELLGKQGQTKAVLLSATLNGDVLSGMITDITERRRLGKELQQEQILWRTLMENLPDRIYFKDRDSRFTRISQSQAHSLGLSDAAEAPGKTDFDFFIESEARSKLEAEQRVMATGEPVVGLEETETWPDGRVGWVSTTKMPLKDPSGAVIGTFGISTDITARKQAEEDLQKEQRLLNTLINSLPDRIYAMDLEGHKIISNTADWKASGGKRLEDVIGKTDRELYPPDLAATFWELDKQVLDSGIAIADQEEPGLDPHGNRVWVSTSKVPLRDGNGQVIGLVGMGRDITERKRTQQALQEYAAKLERTNRDLQDFAYVASHDLQEPLRKIQAFSDRLAVKFGDGLDASGRDYLERMRDASQRMQILINDLLSYSRVVTRGKAFRAVDLNTVAHEVVNDLGDLIERTGGRVEVGPLPTVQADATQMRQLIQNLVANALKFRDAQRAGLVKVAARVDDGCCVISVEDNGIGFDLQYLDRIFKPFERLHTREDYEGSGMGLAICRRIVERHAGSITATSTPGSGASFFVTLPMHQAGGEA
jgi:PAS domain S-box-containing protein